MQLLQIHRGKVSLAELDSYYSMYCIYGSIICNIFDETPFLRNNICTELKASEISAVNLFLFNIYRAIIKPYLAVNQKTKAELTKVRRDC